MTATQLCNIVNNGKCCIGSKGLELLDKVHKGHEADCCFAELLWMSRAIKIMERHTVAGTVESATAVNACGQTNTIVGFAPAPNEIMLNFIVTTFDYNGVPIVMDDTSFPTLIEAMQAIIEALTETSGVTWTFTQINQFQFYLCAPYTQNGDTVELEFEVYFETLLGLITMNVELEGGVAPVTPVVIRTEADNCLTEQEIARISGKFCKIKVQSPQPEFSRTVDVEIRQSDLDIEFR